MFCTAVVSPLSLHTWWRSFFKWNDCTMSFLLLAIVLFALGVLHSSRLPCCGLFWITCCIAFPINASFAPNQQRFTNTHMFWLCIHHSCLVHITRGLMLDLRHNTTILFFVFIQVCSSFTQERLVKNMSRSLGERLF